MDHMRIMTVMTSLVLTLALSFTVIAQRPQPRTTEIDGHTMYTLMEPGGIPAIFNPQFINVNTADSFYYDSEPLMVVISGDDVRGYLIFPR